MKTDEVEQRALDMYMSGYHCAEVISKTIAELFGREPARDIPEVASGFGGGMGRTLEDTCGTLTGGIIALGYLFGRKGPLERVDPVYEIAKEFRERFIQKNGSTRCPAILEKFGAQENMMKCKKMTAEVTGLLAELIMETRS